MLKLIKDIPYTDLGGGVRRRVLSYNDRIMAVEVSFDKGAVGAVHSHPHAQISYVLSGRFEARLGDEVTVISAGDTYATDPDLPHGVVCLESGVLLDVFSPMREDFIK